MKFMPCNDGHARTKAAGCWEGSCLSEYIIGWVKILTFLIIY